MIEWQKSKLIEKKKPKTKTKQLKWKVNRKAK